MNCLNCESHNILTRRTRTNLGYEQYHCRCCGQYFNERSGTAFNFIHYPTDIVMLVVLHYVRYKLSLVDVTELMMLRGFSLSHETVRLWTQQFGADISTKIRKSRWQNVGSQWHMDVTYVFLENRWCYLYRAIDSSRALVDVYLSDTRDAKAAIHFFKQCAKTTGIKPTHITTDKEPALACAIKHVFGQSTKHRDSKYLNNVMEQSHRGIKSRLRARKSSKNTWSAMIFCHVAEEFRELFRTNRAPLSQHRKLFAYKFTEYLELAA